MEETADASPVCPLNDDQLDAELEAGVRSALDADDDFFTAEERLQWPFLRGGSCAVAAESRARRLRG